MTTITDQQLMQWIAAGDESMMGTLFERHHRSLFQFACRMLGDAASAEDIVQEAFIRMLKSARRYRGEGSVKAWMFNIARNLIFDQMRHNSRQSAREPAHFDELEHDAETPEQAMEQGRQQQTLQQAMMRLSRQTREVLLLGRFHTNNFDELAQILDCTVGNARVRVHRAMKQLQEQVRILDQEYCA